MRWDTSDAASFEGGVPYAYKGSEPIEFQKADPPSEFAEAIKNRSMFFDGRCIKLTVDAAAPSPTFICGKYSQSFIDEIALQLTDEIERAMSVEGLADSNIEIKLVFAPDTYMEHTSENVTYRRLLITDKGCGARDFWIKWTRSNSSVAYSAIRNALTDKILFSLNSERTVL